MVGRAMGVPHIIVGKQTSYLVGSCFLNATAEEGVRCAFFVFCLSDVECCRGGERIFLFKVHASNLIHRRQGCLP